jgi:hypothetical protein
MHNSDMLRERADKIERFLENHLVDPDGIIYTMLNEKNMKPFKNAEVLNVSFKKSSDPAEAWGYEDSLMATAEYLMANINKHRLLKDSASLELCRRCFKAIKNLAEAASGCDKGMVRSMFGFLPKPYGGLKNVRNSEEVSIDQYQKIMFSLIDYQQYAAEENERKWIDSFLLACADCWDVNHYAFSYFGRIVRWGVVGRHAIAFGVFCAAVGEKYRPEPHRNWFEIFRYRLAEANKGSAENISDNCASLVLLSMKYLLKCKPSESGLWNQYATETYDAAKTGIDQNGYAWLFPFIYKYKTGERIKPHWIPAEKAGIPFEWDFLRWRGNLFRPCSIMATASADMFEMTDRGQYLDYAQELLSMLGEKGYLKHIVAESPEDLPPGYEIMGDMVNGYNTAAWLRAYWQSARLFER